MPSPRARSRAPRPRPTPLAAVPLLIAGLGLSSCRFRDYEPAPLPGDDELQAWIDGRTELVLPADPNAPAVGPEVDAAQAPGAGAGNVAGLSQVLLERSPDVRSVLARYRGARARADEPTPWPNPTVVLGPLVGFGPDAASPYVVPQFGLGLAFPIGGRLEREDERNLAAAELAWAEAGAGLRGAYLDLRAALLQLRLVRARQAVQADIEAAALLSRDTARRLVDAGEAHALDLTQFALEHARERVRTLEARRDVVDAEQRLAALLALDVEAVRGVRLPGVEPAQFELAPFEELRAALLEAHPDLALARARHALSDRQLRLELARQYPDLGLTLFDQVQPGEDSSQFSVELSLALPLFDRNQGPIAEAWELREAARVDFESTLHRALSGLESSHRRLALALERARMLEGEVVPAARANLQVARASLSAGTAGAIEILDAERSLRQVEVEAIEAWLEAQRAWSDLERAVGLPLLDLGLPVPELRPVGPAPEGTATARGAGEPDGHDEHDCETNTTNATSEEHGDV